MGGKITINLKELHQNEKKNALRKRTRSALSTESMLELRHEAPQVRSARSDSTRVVKVNRRKTNRRKTIPYCIGIQASGGTIGQNDTMFCVFKKETILKSGLSLFVFLASGIV